MNEIKFFELTEAMKRQKSESEIVCSECRLPVEVGTTVVSELYWYRGKHRRFMHQECFNKRTNPK